MDFQITHTEKESIERFKKLKYPSMYKLDDTDNILFVELVDFDVCSMLLKGKPLKKAQYKEILNDYNKYLGQVRLDSFDIYAFMYHNVLIQVMEIFKKYYGHLNF